MDGCPHFAFADSPLVRRIGLGVPAMRYAELGFAVLPLQPGGKRPHAMLGDSGGVHKASRDPAWIRHCWGYDPRANVGIATGQPSGLCVIDLDVKGGVDGMDSLLRFMHGIDPPDRSRMLSLPQPFPWVGTPSGGAHIWLRMPGPVPERPGILPGVDVKGDGGLVVAPPSMRLMTGREGDTVPVGYRWNGCPCQAPPAPGWMAGWLRDAPSRALPGRHDLDSLPDEQDMINAGIPAGQRNDTLYRMTCRLYRMAGTGPAGQEAVRARITRIWQACDRKGMGSRELEGILASGLKFVREAEQAETAAAGSWIRHDERRRT